MAHLIKVDFTCIAKCDMLRLLVTSIIAHMPPASPAREEQVSSTTIKVRSTLQLQWCIFFITEIGALSLHLPPCALCRHISASLLLKRRVNCEGRFSLNACMLHFIDFDKKLPPTLETHWLTALQVSLGNGSTWLSHIWGERERHPKRAKRGGQSEGQGDSRSISWRRPLAMRIRTQLTRKHWSWMSFLKLKKSAVQGPPSQPTNNGTKWGQYLFPLLSLGPSYRSHASSLFFGLLCYKCPISSLPSHNSDTPVSTESSWTQPSCTQTASLLSSDHAEERRQQEISNFSFSAHHRSVTTTFSYVLHGGYRYKKYGVLAMAWKDFKM